MAESQKDQQYAPGELENGGKAASWLSIYNAGLTDRLLPLTLVNPERTSGQSHYSIEQIVRGSSRGDATKGLVDRVSTYSHVPSSKIHEKIQSMTKLALREEIQNIAQWEGITDYDGIRRAMIQPQITQSDRLRPGVLIRGSIVDHPNIEDHYLVNIVFDAHNPNFPNGKIEQYLVDQNGKILKTAGGDALKCYISDIIQMRHETDEVGFLSNWENKWSTQTEFVVVKDKSKIKPGEYDYQTMPTSDTVFAQKRIFARKAYDNPLNPVSYEFNFFGKLSNKNLRVVKLDLEFGLGNPHEVREMMNDGIPSVYVMDGNAAAIPGWFMPNNLVGVVFPMTMTGYHQDTIEHNTTRWVQKAQFSCLHTPFIGRFMGDMYTQGENVDVQQTSLSQSGLGVSQGNTDSLFDKFPDLPYPDDLFK